MWPLLVVAVVVSLIYCLLCCFGQDEVVESFTSFYKCPKYANTYMFNKVFNQQKIERIDQPEKSDIYVPCGYNHVERELRQLDKFHKNQKIFGINGCDNIVSKNGLWNILDKTYGRKEASRLMPETYIISRGSDLQLFKKNYQTKKIYLLKKNIQRKKGIHLSDNLDDIMQKCNENYKVIQEYVPDLYLLKGRKINLRIYLLVTCQNGSVSAYMHRDGKCIYTNKPYRPNSLNPEEHLTSLNVTNDVYKGRPLSLPQLRDFLGRDKFQYLMNNIVKNLTMVMRASKDSLCRLKKLDANLTFQLFGLDYVFTDKLYPYLLEMNKGPDLYPKTRTDSLIKEKVVSDVLRIVNVIQESDDTNGFFQLSI